jgi:2-dehydropantoate 2-reductase
MRILVVGAGATGGYFGGRLLEAGADVTFLVRPKRAAQLQADGLRIVSPHGNVTLQPPLVTADTLQPGYGVVLLAVKAYALDAAIDDLAPAMADGTMILPILNGMRHIDRLVHRFGEAAVIGGVCIVATMLDPAGRIVQLAPMQELSYGERDGSLSSRVKALDAALQGAGFTARLTDGVMQAMWEKWTFLATLGALTCLLRGPIGAIVAAPGGLATAEALLAECAAVSAAEGFPPGAAFMGRIRGLITAPDSTLTSSMYRDLQSGAPVEAEQILGDMQLRAEQHGLPTPLLRAAFAQLSIYQAGQAKLA